MSYSDEEIQRFLNGQGDPSERERIASYLRTHQDSKLFDELSKEWDNADKSPLEDPKLKRIMWTEIQNELDKEKTWSKKSGLFYGKVVSLACVIVAVAVWLSHSVVSRNHGAVKSKILARSQWVDTVNHSYGHITISLPDGSAVRLSGGSRLRYFRDTVHLIRRNLYLKGNAFFEVAKDRAHPFTVHTGIISTTALGTGFSVSNRSGHVLVKLYTGKVWLRKEQKTNTLSGWRKGIVLTPGQSMDYDSATVRTTVAAFSLQGRTKVHKANTFNSDSGVLSSKKMTNNLPKILEFNNTPLIKVFQQLENQFSIKIHYRSEVLTGLRFSGQVYGTDTPDNVLMLICNLNDLVLVKERANYRVEKK